MLRALIAAITLLFAAQPLHAQTQSQTTLTDLSTWQVHPGNIPPDGGFDPAPWQPTHPGDTLTLPPHTTDLWYRTQVTLAPGEHDLSLTPVADNLVDPALFNGCPEYFVNGIRIGQARGFPHCFGTTSDFFLLPIPNQSLRGNDLVLTLHFVFLHEGPAVARGGFSAHTHLLLGNSRELEGRRDLYLFRDYSSNAIRALLILIVLAIVIALARNVPQPTEYRLLIVFLLSDLATNLLLCATCLPAVQTNFVFNTLLIAGDFINIVVLVSFTEFVRVVLGFSRSRLYLFYLGLFVVVDIILLLFLYIGNASVAAENNIRLAVFIISLPITAFLPLLTLWAWRRQRNPDALLLSIPLLVRSIVTLDLLLQMSTGALFHHSRSLLPKIHYVSWFEVFDIAFIITLLLFVVIRTVRIARERTRIAAEVHAAQSVQQLLLNRSTLSTPGFHVETVYLPASEVGGDFFLISPAPPTVTPSQSASSIEVGSSPADRGLLVIIGDVSGKGLTAAMRVAMILGVLRRETSRDPAQILTNLNEALLAPNGGPPELGFTTACCLHIASNGVYRIASAGHINPYLTGPAQGEVSAELQSPPALPLGLAPGQTYETLSGTLNPTQTLVLLTDGIPEARNPRGNLYGFDALPALAQHPAKEIAQTAQLFGQEDDITVLTLSLA